MASLVTDKGLANAVTGWHGYASRARHLQWGEGNGAGVTDNVIAAAGNTTEDRTAGTTTPVTTTTTDDTYQVSGTITALDTLAITELGVFDAAGSGSPPTGGNMCIYGDFTVVNLSVSDSITFTVQVVLDQA